MINKILLVGTACAIGLASLVSEAFADSPTFVSTSSSGTSTSVVYFATQPVNQARLVSVIASSDLAAANIIMKAGTTPVTCAYTNPASTSFGVAATTGFTVGDFVLVETQTGAITNAQIASFGAATNIVFADKVMATRPGDQCYKLGAATKLFCGVQTNRNYQGMAIFVAPRGRPMTVYVNGTSACSIDTATVHYDQ